MKTYVKVECYACEIKFKITAENYYKDGYDIDIRYCPVCSAELMDEDERAELIDYMSGEQDE